MEKNFKREIEALNDIFAFVESFIAANKIDSGLAFSINLAVEELFTNLVKHNIGGIDHITVSFEKDANKLIIRLKDFDVEPFDINEIGEVDTQEPLEDRGIGGLGLHLVKSVVDKVTYEYADRTVCVTAIKNLEGKDV